MARVVVIGAGVTGLTAAHELVERGFAVEVHDRWGADRLGGKAATQYVSRELGPDRTAVILPGEHGYRFFPSFYRHLEDTMRRIPFGARGDTGRSTVADNLVPVGVEAVGFADGLGLATIERRFPRSLDAVLQVLHTMLERGNYTVQDVMQLQAKIFQFMTTCRERRTAEYEEMSWWEFMHRAEVRYSAPFDRQVNDWPKLLVAMDARQGAAKAQGEVFVQMLLDQVSVDARTDRVLNGPTTERWLDPWREHLVDQGVAFHHGTNLDRFTGADHDLVPDWGGAPADYYVLALPFEEARAVMAASPGLDDTDVARGLIDLDPQRCLATLTGVQFFLTDDVRILRGHVCLPDSEWGLSMISQAQFWGPDFRTRYGHGAVGTVLSVDIGNWDAPGGTGRAAADCGREELVAEVWRQLSVGLRGSGLSLPPWAVPDPPPPIVAAYHVDSNIEWVAPRKPVNRTPMFVNPPGSWKNRPGSLESGYRLLGGRLVVAGDYAQTHTGLPTMEAANESARHAVNAILLDATTDRRTYEPCRIWPLEENEPPDLKLLKEVDRKLWEKGRPHFLEILDWQSQLRLLQQGLASTKALVDALSLLLSGRSTGRG